MATPIGISFGTSYSSVGIYTNGSVTIFPNEHGNTKTACCVAFTDDGMIVGDTAKVQTFVYVLT
jgi:molecular chaperone DnaK (HSP70)